MSTVQALLEAAYAGSTANDAGKLAKDAELIGVLNRRYQQLWALMAAHNGDAMAVSAALAALAGNPPSAVLPTDTIDILRVQTAAGARVNLIPIAEKDRAWHLAPAVYRQGASLVSRNGAGDPIATDVLTIYHCDAPVALAALATVLDSRFPVRWEQILITELQLYLAAKDEARRPEELKMLANDFDGQMALFNAVYQVTGAAQSPHKAVIAAARQGSR